MALKIDRSTVRDTSSRPDDALLREAMKAAAMARIKQFVQPQMPLSA